MVICFRCQINISQVECEICNGFYCSDCDKFIHSKKPKNNHVRKQLKIITETNNEKNNPKIQLDFKPNLTYDIQDMNINIINNVINNKNIENENNVESKIFPQTYEIERKNNNIINNNIYEKNNEQVEKEDLNNNYIMQKNMSDCMKNINNIINEEYEFKLDEKDSEIISLQKQIEDQRSLINNLKQENNDLEQQIEETNSELGVLYQERDRLINQKRTINEFYTGKQSEIEKIHELDKYKLIEDYEDQMRQISQDYLSKKTDCIKGIQEIEDKMREIENNKEEEKRVMWEEIERLKNEGNNIDKEQEYLIKSNDELNSKLKETSNNIDLLRANTLGNNISKQKVKKKIKIIDN